MMAGRGSTSGPGGAGPAVLPALGAVLRGLAQAGRARPPWLCPVSPARPRCRVSRRVNPSALPCSRLVKSSPGVGCCPRDRFSQVEGSLGAGLPCLLAPPAAEGLCPTQGSPPGRNAPSALLRACTRRVLVARGSHPGQLRACSLFARGHVPAPAPWVSTPSPARSLPQDCLQHCTDARHPPTSTP